MKTDKEIWKEKLNTPELETVFTTQGGGNPLKDKKLFLEETEKGYNKRLDILEKKIKKLEDQLLKLIKVNEVIRKKIKYAGNTNDED